MYHLLSTIVDPYKKKILQLVPSEQISNLI